MSGYRMVVVVDTDELTVVRASRIVKEALASLDVEVFTFEEAQFCAHWKPLAEPVGPPRSRVFDSEHRSRTTPYRSETR